MSSTSLTHSPAAVLFGVVASTVSAAAQVTVEFDPIAIDVIEDQSVASVTIVPSAPIVGHGGVLLSTFDGSATSGDDYSPITAFVDWTSGDDSPRTVEIPLVNDLFPEPVESFEVRLTNADGVLIGENDTVTITVFDDDGGPIAAIDVGEAFENPLGGLAFVGEAGTLMPITITLGDIPDEPVTVEYESTFPAGDGSVVFDGSAEETVYVELPELSSDVYAEGQFRLTGSSGRATTLQTLAFDTDQAFEVCVYCGFYFMHYLLGFDVCPTFCGLAECGSPATRSPVVAPRFMGSSAVETLRRYRDEVLVGTDTGTRYIELYEEHSGAAFRSLLGRPDVVYRLIRAQMEWVPAIAEFVNGGGDGTTVSQSMEDRLNAVLDGFEELGDPTFADLIAAERARFRTDQIAGLSLTELQEHFETLGGSVPTEAIRWSAIKHRFRR